MNVAYGTITFNIQYTPLFNNEEYSIALASEIAGAEVIFTTNGTLPDERSETYRDPIKITRSCIINALPVFNGEIMGQPYSKAITFHKAVGKKTTYADIFDSKYPATGEKALVNGMMGSDNFADGFWQGFFGKDCDIVIDLDVPQQISKLSINSLQNSTSWILFPEKVVFSVSNDAQSWKIAGTRLNDVDPFAIGRLTQHFSVSIEEPEPYRYVRMTVQSRKTCPKGHPAEGSNCWLFVDEAMVE